MKHIIKEAIASVGLEAQARSIWRLLRVNGWTPWQPLVPEAAFCYCVRDAVDRLRASDPEGEFGDYLEFGVSRGTSMACAYRALRDAGLHHVRLIGFDSFEGLPPEAAKEGWAPGEFCSTLEATRAYLKRHAVDVDRVILKKGWFKETLTDATRLELGIAKASFIMVDCDLYSASREALSFCEPLIRDRAIIIFDDWGSAEGPEPIGQEKAFSEFLARNPDLTAEPLASYSSGARVFQIRRL